MAAVILIEVVVVAVASVLHWLGVLAGDRSPGLAHWLSLAAVLGLPVLVIALGALAREQTSLRNDVLEVTAEIRRDEENGLSDASNGELRDRILSVLHAPDAVTMVFQPIVDATSGTMVGVEALARFHVEPVQPPDVWFAEAASVGLGTELEVLCLRRALDRIDELPGSYLSMNVSPATVLSEEFQLLVPELTRYPDRIVLELTEHADIAGYPQMIEALRGARAAGVRVAVDDAGSGYSSFQRILELRPDFIKLDTTLVRNVHADPARRALANAVADFASDIDATVIAEGIEVIDELKALRSAGVALVQGYLCGPPSTLPLPAPPAMDVGDSLSVLVVDDDPVVRVLVAKVARRAGLAVVGQASDGAQALAQARALQPDVVITDLAMPVLDGAHALPELRLLLPDAQIIVLSSRDPSSSGELLRRGADTFLAKQEATLQLPAMLEALKRTRSG